jgi:hypothetical protein
MRQFVNSAVLHNPVQGALGAIECGHGASLHKSRRISKKINGLSDFSDSDKLKKFSGLANRVTTPHLAAGGEPRHAGGDGAAAGERHDWAHAAESRAASEAPAYAQSIRSHGSENPRHVGHLAAWPGLGHPSEEES